MSGRGTPVAGPFGMACDGTETICVELTDEGAVAATGGGNTGGAFSAQGYQPTNGGGLEWRFGGDMPLDAGRIEVDLTGLVPSDADEGSGGKVSIFDMCATDAGQADYLGLQKMTWDYHDGHIFRYGMDDDELADNWDAAVITASDMGCLYSVADWQPDQTHHVAAEWSRDGVFLWIDDFECHGWGNGDTFDAADKVLVLGNRCQHYDNQQAVAWFSGFRLWARGTGGGGADTGPADTGSPPADTGSPPADTGTCATPMQVVAGGASADSGLEMTLTTRFDHCQGPDGFTMVQVAVADQPGVGGALVTWMDGQLVMEGYGCLPGEARVLEGRDASLDCAASSVTRTGDSLVLFAALSFNPAFEGAHVLWGSATDPSGTTGWVPVGAFMVTTDEAAPVAEGCGCGALGGGRGVGWLLVAGILTVTRRLRGTGR